MKPNQTIVCATMAQFMAVIADLAERGIGFEADVDSKTIKLTGAF